LRIQATVFRFIVAHQAFSKRETEHFSVTPKNEGRPKVEETLQARERQLLKLKKK
jgi:hypothetical protein